MPHLYYVDLSKSGALRAMKEGGAPFTKEEFRVWCIEHACFVRGEEVQAYTAADAATQAVIKYSTRPELAYAPFVFEVRVG